MRIAAVLSTPVFRSPFPVPGFNNIILRVPQVEITKARQAWRQMCSYNFIERHLFNYHFMAPQIVLFHPDKPYKIR